MIGIYKITSPSGKIYIGQSVNIEKRFKEYQFLYNIKNQTKLYNSFKKHGIDAHKFEVVVGCEVSELNDLERYYQDLYNVINNGLNCKLTKSSDRSGKHSKETRKKISEAHIGKKQTEEHRNKITASKIGRKRCPIKTALRAKKRIKPLINRETGETYCSVKEAAEKLGIKTNTLYGAIHAETRGFYKNKYNICYA